MIREARSTDIGEIAKIHTMSLPEDFLPRLGNWFLRHLFYPEVVNSERALVIVQEEFGKICSFVVFAYDSDEIVRAAARRKTILAVQVSAAIARNFGFLRDVISHLKGSTTRLDPDFNDSLDNVPELYVMATAPECQSQGYGGALLDRGMEILSRSHSKCLVKTSSIRAREFYKRHGFHEIGKEYRGSRELHLLLHG